MKIFITFLISLNSFADLDISTRRNQIKSWATECSYQGNNHVMSLSGKARSENICDQGDAVLFAGLSCLAASLAGDRDTKKWRCRDVSDSQDSRGRWWRGVTRIEAPNQVSFSRDMGLGVLAYLIAMGDISENSADRMKAISQGKAWINWIEKSGSGKFMCLEKKNFLDNRCKINTGFASLMYRTLKKIGAIDSTNQDYKVIKKLHRNKKYYPDMFTSKEAILQYQLLQHINQADDYEFHLKSIHVLLARLIGEKTGKYIDELMRNVFLYEPQNPVYQLLYRGVTPESKSKLLEICPATRQEVLADVSWLGKPLFSETHTSWWPQRSFDRMFYKKANGHDCIFAMNLYLAQENRKLYVNLDRRRTCPRGTSRLSTDGILISCIASESISVAECEKFGGIKVRDRCLQKRRDFHLLYNIEGSCPSRLTLEGNIEKWPICSSTLKVRLDKCNKFDNKFKKDGSCFKFESGHWRKEKISYKCPGVMKKIDHLKSWDWLMCKPKIAKKVKREDCPKVIYKTGGRVPYIVNGYCGEISKGYFKALKIKK